MTARLSLLLVGLFLAPALGAAPSVRFNTDIRPILSDKCFSCHGPDEKNREADLRLDTREGATADRHGTIAIVPGKPEASELVARISTDDPGMQMPPPETNKGLTGQEKELIQRWIAEGAPYEGHWSFLPVRAVVPPQVKSTSPIHNPIDHFVLHKLDSAGLQPSSEAERSTLIRRVYLDLLGLLPTPDEVDAFIGDTRPTAYEELVDRLLANPHYGERWGRYWLDQARYADSNGYTIDGERTMWPYRDWVIQALNEDMPFDQFTIEQLAGDLLSNPTKSQLIATGFHRNTLINQEGGTDPEQFRNEEVVDRVNTTGAVWLGLTVGCAQCHTHKYDPITHKEYYQLFAFFNHTQDVNNTGPTLDVHEREVFLEPSDSAEWRLLEQATTEYNRLLATKAKRQAEWEKTLLAAAAGSDSSAGKDAALLAALAADAKKRSAEQKKLVEAAFAAADEPFQKATAVVEQARRNLGLGAPAKAMIMRELPKPRETFVHTRGDFLRPDKELGLLTPNVPAALTPLPNSSSAVAPNRLDLARWLVSKDNPLTARVTVNRVWMRYFGRGLVETENDFGSQGSPPTHPELLDWLAGQFMEQGWSLKRLHRWIVTSATYRQSSQVNASAAKDPLNLLLSRQTRLRLDAEAIRDVALSSSGLLSPRIGGPSVRPPQPEGVYSFTQSRKAWTAESGSNRFRRAMYTMFYRSAPYPMLTTFDAPDFQSVCTRRPRSNTPLQSLTMANDQAIFEMAQELAVRVLRELPGASEVDMPRIRRAFALCFAREPQGTEADAVSRFLKLQRERFAADPEAARAVAAASAPGELSVMEVAAWTAVARALMNTDEFITRE